MSTQAHKAPASKLPGLGLCFMLAVLSVALSRWPLLQQVIPLSPLMLAIGLGALLGNLAPLPTVLKPGLTFALKKLLRLGIILLGFKISLIQVQSLGWQSLLLLTICVTACFGFTVWLGKVLGLSPKLSLLLASGTSICGASAIVATDAVIEADEADTAYALATITLFGTLGMLAYPLLQLLLKLTPQAYALWTGASLHEVGQVVAAGFAHGEETGKLASLVKMARVIFLIPVAIGLLVWSLRGQAEQTDKKRKLDWKKVPIPWFVFGFLAVIGLNSLQLLPPALTNALVELDMWLLTMSMAALGLETHLDKLRATGLKPLWLGLASSLLISLLALGLLGIIGV